MISVDCVCAWIMRRNRNERRTGREMNCANRKREEGEAEGLHEL